MNARLVLAGASFSLLACTGRAASRSLPPTEVASGAGSEQKRGAMTDDEALRGIEALRRRDEAASKAYDVKALAALWTDDAVAMPPGGAVTRAPLMRAQLAAMAEAARNSEVLEYREIFEETLVFGTWRWSGAASRARSGTGRPEKSPPAAFT